MRSTESGNNRQQQQQQHNESRDEQQQSQQQQQQQQQQKSRQQSRRSDNYLNYEDTRQLGVGSSSKVGSSSSKQHSQHSFASTGPPAHLEHPEPPGTFISPRDRLFGLSSEVHTFSTELLEKTSDGILRASKVGDLQALKQLHSRGYSLLSIDATGQTGLHLASRLGHKDIVRYLIACAPPTILNMVDNDKGQTALHKAAQQKRRSICCMLVAGGAKLTVRDRNGNTPRELALQAEDRDLAAYLHSQEQFQLVTEDTDNMA